MKTWIKILIALFLLGILAGIAGYFIVYNKPHRDIAKAKPDFIITAAELYDAFASNPSEASAMYNGRVLQISGRIDEKEVVDDMVILVFIFDDGMFGPEGVRCTMLPAASARAMNIMVGDYITVKGLCTGFTGVDVILDKCSVIE